jgi:hypothetical protein
MTTEEIICLAEKAGFSQEDDNMFICGIEHIKKLLGIEREACAEIAEKHFTYYGYQYIADDIRARGKA